MLRLTAVRRSGSPLWFWGGQATSSAEAGSWAGSSSAAGASRRADEWWLCGLGRVSGVGRVGDGACPARARRGRLGLVADRAGVPGKPPFPAGELAAESGPGGGVCADGGPRGVREVVGL